MGNHKRFGACLAVGGAVGLLWLVAGCGGSVVGSDQGGPDSAAGRVVTEFNLIPFQDQWPSSKPRWLDIGDVGYTRSFTRGFNSASSGTITLRYETNPGVGYFTGWIRGSGLKPNFCYQMKLMGRPGTASSGLWSGTGDMVTNERILRAGRWWDYKTEAAIFNTTNADQAVASADYQAGWVAGYLFFGDFVTNQFGNTDITGDGLADFIPIAANHCYHITGKTGQEGMIGQDTPPVPYDLLRTTSYGYGSASSDVVSLWYEKELDNPIDVSLAPGVYSVVLMITEESFHATSANGGNWRSVRVSDWPTIKSPKTHKPWVSGRGTPITFTIN